MEFRKETQRGKSPLMITKRKIKLEGARGKIGTVQKQERTREDKMNKTETTFYELQRSRGGNDKRRRQAKK